MPSGSTTASILNNVGDCLLRNNFSYYTVDEECGGNAVRSEGRTMGLGMGTRLLVLGALVGCVLGMAV